MRTMTLLLSLTLAGAAVLSAQGVAVGFAYHFR
jgi:hypothetical protein